MKGITLCADCAYYNMRTHKCKRGATGEPDLSKGDDVRFFTDCPLTEAEPVRRGRFVFEKGDGKTCLDGWICTACKFGYHTNVPYIADFKYCPACGARMDGGADNVSNV